MYLIRHKAAKRRRQYAKLCVRTINKIQTLREEKSHLLDQKHLCVQNRLIELLEEISKQGKARAVDNTDPDGSGSIQVNPDPDRIRIQGFDD
jgi:hypothetical protein